MEPWETDSVHRRGTRRAPARATHSLDQGLGVQSAPARGLQTPTMEMNSGRLGCPLWWPKPEEV